MKAAKAGAIRSNRLRVCVTDGRRRRLRHERPRTAGGQPAPPAAPDICAPVAAICGHPRAAALRPRQGPAHALRHRRRRPVGIAQVKLGPVMEPRRPLPHLLADARSASAARGAAAARTSRSATTATSATCCRSGSARAGTCSTWWRSTRPATARRWRAAAAGRCSSSDEARARADPVRGARRPRGRAPKVTTMVVGKTACWRAEDGHGQGGEGEGGRAALRGRPRDAAGRARPPRPAP